MNNVFIVGMANKDVYAKAIMEYCEPDDLVLYVFQANNTTDLNFAARELNIEVKIVPADNKIDALRKTLCFTSYIGITEVMAVEEANKAMIDFVIINPLKK